MNLAKALGRDNITRCEKINDGSVVYSNVNIPYIEYEMKLATMNEVLDNLLYEIVKQKNLAGVMMKKDAIGEVTYNILQGKIMTLNSVENIIEFIRKECIAAWTRDKVKQLKKN